MKTQLVTKKPRHFFIWFVVLLAIVATAFAGCGTSRETVKSLVSPDGKHTAIIVEGGGDGDATVGFFRLAALCAGSGGCSAGKNNTFASANGTGLLNLSWSDNQNLVVFYSPMATKTYGKTGKIGDDKVGDVSISYVPFGK